MACMGLNPSPAGSSPNLCTSLPPSEHDSVGNRFMFSESASGVDAFFNLSFDTLCKSMTNSTRNEWNQSPIRSSHHQLNFPMQYRNRASGFLELTDRVGCFQGIGFMCSSWIYCTPLHSCTLFTHNARGILAFLNSWFWWWSRICEGIAADAGGILTFYIEDSRASYTHLRWGAAQRWESRAITIGFLFIWSLLLYHVLSKVGSSTANIQSDYSKYGVLWDSFVITSKLRISAGSH